MKTNIRLGWLAPVLALGIGLRAAGQEPMPASGKILILANDRVLEGEIDRLGDQYRIRRGMGETIIAAKLAKKLCADWPGALAFLRSQANLNDPDERLRLAKWCHQHGLTADALVEIRTAFDMRPTHPESKQLLILLQRAATPSAAPAAMQVVNIAPPVAIVPAAPKTTPSAPPLDLSADTFSTFNNKVHPILINACASCHTGNRAGGFSIQRMIEGSGRATIQSNMIAAVMQLKLDNPAASPLIVKAVSAHGNLAQPPLRDRRTIPAQTLLQWAEQVAANNPHLREPNAVAVAPRSSPESAVPLTSSFGNPTAGVPVVSKTVTRLDNPEPGMQIVNFQAALLAQQSPLPTKTPPRVNQRYSTIDEYSADQFNQAAPRK